MKELLKRITFLLCFILVLPTVSPMAATNGQLMYEFDYSYNTFAGQNAITSKGDFIVSEVTHIRENGKSVYRSDLSLLTNDGVQKFLTIANPSFVTYEDVVYTYTYDNNAKTLNLYDEQLNLVASETLPFSDDNNSIYINPYKNYLVLTQQFYNASIGQFSSESLYYNFVTQSFEENISLPTTRSFVDSNIGIVLTNDYGQVKQVIPYRNLKFKGEPYEAIYANGKLILITKQSSEQTLYHLYNLNLDGSIIDSKSITVDPALEEAYIQAFLLNDTLTLYLYSYSKNKTIVYDYNLSTKTLSNGKTYPTINYSWFVNDDIYVESVNAQNSKTSTYKTRNGEIITSFESYNAYSSTYTTADINEYNLLVKTFDYQTQKSSAMLYDIQTKELIAQFSGDTDYRLINKPNYLDVLDGEYRASTGLYTDLKGSLYYVGKDLPIKPEPEPTPTGPTYEPNKMWTVTTSKTIDTAKVSASNVYVKDASGQQIATTFSVKGNQLFIYAPEAGYESKQTYTLNVEGLVSVDGDLLKEPKSKEFKIK